MNSGMNRRRLLAMGGAAVAGLAAGKAGAQQQLEQFRPGKDYNDLIILPPTDRKRCSDATFRIAL